MPRINNQTFYENAIKRYGCTAKGLNWNSKNSQYTRFEALFDLISHHVPTSKIVDAGCGFGDLYLFLRQKGTLPRHYVGYDVLQEALFVAQKRTKQRCEQKNILEDILEPADLYIASGSMNILNRFETFLFIRRCYEASHKGFVFNLLMGEEKKGHFNHFMPEEIEAYVNEFVYDVVIKDDYMQGDFTVLLKKESF